MRARVQSVDPNRPFFSLSAFAAAVLFVNLLLIFALSLDLFSIYLLIVLCTLMFFFLVERNRLGLLLVGMLPLSQAIPLYFGKTATGLVPEYLVLPFLAFWFQAARLKNARLSFEKTGLFVPSILFLSIALFSLVISGSYVGFSKTVSGFGTWFVMLLGLVFLYVLLEWIKSEEHCQLVLYVLFISTSIVALIGIVEYLLLADQADFTYRITSSFGQVFWKKEGGNPNVLGAYLMAIALLGFSLRKSYVGHQRWLIRLTIVLSTIALVLTGSRSALVAYLVGVLMIAVRRDRRVLMWLVPILVLPLAVLLAIPRVANRVSSTFQILSDPEILNFFSTVDPKRIDWQYIGLFGLGGYSVDVAAGANRIAAWIQGWKIFLAHPVLGIGLQMNQHYTGFATSENLFLDMAAMTGLLGLVALGWLLTRVAVVRKAKDFSTASSFAKSFRAGYSTVLIGLGVVSLTGSVLLHIKLLLTITLLTAVLWRLSHLRTEEPGR